MNSYIDILGQKRQQILDGLDANDRDINLDIFEDFYPDQAHFVFELLQNAEDAGATEATFTLCKVGCEFVHNGRDFTEEDVRSITGIHSSTKSNSSDQIGRFGVGFKSVFVYTQEPVIYSGDFAFKIVRLVKPELVDSNDNARGKTTFWLPFNNSRTLPEIAYSEVEAALGKLADSTLLFLTHLQAVRWKTDTGTFGEVRRIAHSDCHVELRTQSSNTTIDGSHFLKFDQPVEDLESQRLSVAFALEFLPNVEQFDEAKPIVEQMKIVPANPGQVAVYFPAENETSGLRFHIHAPFVPELSRASIKKTPANKPLFQQLASLVASSLHQIRDIGLLTADFLAVLPNPQDQLPRRYTGIREAIIEEMNSQPVTPTHAKKHAPARQLLQAKASLKELLSEKDLAFLVPFKKPPVCWAIGAHQKDSHTSRFLQGLEITKWDVDDFVTLMRDKMLERRQISTSSRPCSIVCPNKEFMAWLSRKSLAWHQCLYALLHAAIDQEQSRIYLKDLRIIRLASGEYATGDGCFFPGKGTEHDDDVTLLRIDARCYTSGKDNQKKHKARQFLEAMGVRVAGEAEQIEQILDKRYKSESAEFRSDDLTRFMTFVDECPDRAEMFQDYFIFEGEDGRWHKPCKIFIDEPFMDTGLSAYYAVAIARRPTRYALARTYHRSDSGDHNAQLVCFAKAVGAISHLPVHRTTCKENPMWEFLDQITGRRRTSPIDIDYTIRGIPELFSQPTRAASRLVWRTMETIPSEYLKAWYQKNRERSKIDVPSQLVHCLRTTRWIPQGNDRFVRPAEADRDLLPEDFAFDAEWSWLKEIDFGENAVRKPEARREKQEQEAKKLGFPDVEGLHDGQRFAKLPAEVRKQILVKLERERDLELPHHEPSDPQGRARRVGAQAMDAPERRFDRRPRSVAVGRESVKEEAGQYLRQQYTKDSGEMICQVCKSVLPFRLDDGREYFEKVEFLDELKGLHYQNYLALCPNHAAMFQHAIASRGKLRESLVAISGNTLDVILARNGESIYFTTTHIEDLKSVLASDAVRRDTGTTE